MDCLLSIRVMNGEWWQQAFQAEYLDIYAHRDDQSAAQEVAGISSKLTELTGPILDACCGNGRHAEALQHLGYDVFAFDYSADLLAVAARRASLRGRLFQADVQALPLQQRFAAVTLFFTAFGYFDDDSNAAVLRGLHQISQPGALLMLDLPDPAQVRASLVPASEKNTPSGLQVSEERRLDGSLMIKDVRIHVDGVLQRSYSERVRLYEHEELIALAAAAGYDFDVCWPGLLGPHGDQQRKVYWFKK